MSGINLKKRAIGQALKRVEKLDKKATHVNGWRLILRDAKTVALRK